MVSKQIKNLFLFLLFLQPVAMRGNYTFEHIGVQNGLSQSSVYSILQDKMGFMWFGTRSGLNRFDGNRIKVYRAQNTPHSLGSDIINELYEDKQGQIWVATDEGVFIYTPQTDSFRRFSMRSNTGETIKNNVTLLQAWGDNIYIAANEQGLFEYNTKTQTLSNYRLKGHPNISGLGFDAHGNMWIGFFGGGLYYTTDHLRTLHPFLDSEGKEVFAIDIVSSILSVNGSMLLVGTDRHGLSELYLQTRTHRSVLPLTSGKSPFVRGLKRKGNDIWVASEMGLYIYNLQNRSVQHYAYEPSNPFSLSDNPLYSLCQDREGGMWIGSYFGGVNYVPAQYPLFDKFIPRYGVDGTLHGRRIKEMTLDANGKVWIGTEDAGLNCFDPSSRKFAYVTESANFPNIQGLCVDGNRLWVGTFSYGLKVIDMNSRKVVKSFLADGQPGALRDNTIFSICRSTQGDLWFGTVRGLCRFNPSTNGFDYVDKVPFVLINKVFEDTAGRLWVVTQVCGVFCRDNISGNWRHYTRSNSGLLSDKVLNVYEDSRNNLWFCTQNAGICRYHPRTGRFVKVPVPRYAPEQTVFQIREDRAGKLWLSTYNGLICYDPKTENSKNYTTANGLLDNQFNYASSLVDRQGYLYFGSLNGFVRFLPPTGKGNTDSPDILATELRIGNSVVDNFSENSPLTQSITFTKALSLASNQNSFSIRMAALGYSTPRQSQMEYMLKGYDDEWQYLRLDNYIAYSNLPAGHYTLLVRMKGDADLSIKAPYQLDITIEPPLLLSFWAKLLYLLIFIVVLWQGYAYYHKRQKHARQLAFERLEHEKEQELYQSKINFFTNVAHEIRTPLTLIKGPLENIIGSKKIDDKGVQEDLDVMSKNTNRLNDLINQLLDFRKAESNGMRMNFERCNINKIVEDTYERFVPVIREKGVHANFSMKEENIYAYVDREGLTKIVSNLINNAVKYGDKVLNVSLGCTGDAFVLTVSNDGNLIPQSMHRKIFEPFFRMDGVNGSTTTGTGIGLAMAHSLTELHQGSLTLEPDAALNTFKLVMPIEQGDMVRLQQDEEAQTASETTPQAFVKQHEHTVLVVEDNLQMLEYEKKRLQKEYDVLTATDGEEALRVLAEYEVSAIVSDIMMEPMDGLTLCKTVKQNVEYSHVPVILLTAVTMEAAKMQGMENGADDYIVKPFSMDYLLSTIQNLISTRANIKQAYADSPFISSESVSISKADAEFLKRLREVMDKNMANSDLNVDKMAFEMNMSRTNLNRKIRGTLNLSTNDYIKVERLKRAARLLKEGHLKINEVCYTVGFSTPSYFTKCFYKQFGLLPKEFMEQ